MGQHTTLPSCSELSGVSTGKVYCLTSVIYRLARARLITNELIMTGQALCQMYAPLGILCYLLIASHRAQYAC